MAASDFIKVQEGFRTKAYLDRKGIPTIGWGSCFYENGDRVKLGDVITQAHAEILLHSDINRRWNAIKGAVKVPVNDNQIVSIVSLTYNIGVGGFLGSTLLKKINSKATEEEIRAAFYAWHKVTIKVAGVPKKVPDKGLMNRRKREADLYFSKNGI